jgi:hypothetical protein
MVHSSTKKGTRVRTDGPCTGIDDLESHSSVSRSPQLFSTAGAGNFNFCAHAGYTGRNIFARLSCDMPLAALLQAGYIPWASNK